MEYSRLPIDNVLRNELRNYVFDIISCMHEVHNDFLLISEQILRHKLKGTIIKMEWSGLSEYH